MSTTYTKQGRWLLDVNVLLALAWPGNENHPAARTWLAAHAAEGICTCPITQMGFVRVSSNPMAKGMSATPAEAGRVLEIVLRLGHHTFWPAALTWAEVEAVHGPLNGYRQTTDAYLLGLARANGGKLLTLDRGVLALRGAEGVAELLA